MAVEKVFWKNPYLTQIEAKITGINNNRITLDRTIVFAFSGGQQSDSGTIGGYEILGAEKIGLEIYYRLDQNHTLKKGQLVLVKIDWEKRYKIMKLHLAAELILEMVYQQYNRPEKIGANITYQKARVDFFWQENISVHLPYLERMVNDLIKANLNITSAFDGADEANERRCWEIKGFARVSCGGTHIRRTGEIGPVTLKRKNIGAGRERIEIYLV